MIKATLNVIGIWCALIVVHGAELADRELAEKVIEATGLTSKWDMVIAEKVKQIKVHVLLNSKEASAESYKYLDDNLTKQVIMDLYVNEMIKVFSREDLNRLYEIYNDPVMKKVVSFEADKVVTGNIDRLLKEAIRDITNKAIKAR